MIKGFDTGVFNVGDVKEIDFVQKIPLRIGKYTLSLGCTKFIGDELHIFHRLYDVIVMDVISNSDTAGIIHVDSIMKMKKC